MERVGELLSSNSQIDTLKISGPCFDRELWDLLVRPHLNCNLFRKRCKAIQNIAGRGSFRAGVLAEGLVKVNDDPAIIWMLLSMNQDFIAESLYTALRHDGLAPRKKRPWSTS